MIKRLAGGFMLAFGALLACWIVYATLINRPPENERMSPIPAILFSGGLLYVGSRWIRGEIAD